jgi:hypothetical protein
VLCVEAAISSARFRQLSPASTACMCPYQQRLIGLRLIVRLG